MDLAEAAFIARMRGQYEKAQTLFFEAYSLEKVAALATPYDLEPTRSVLFRSAASLAMNAGAYEDGKELIFKALAGNPPVEIIDELHDLLDQILQNEPASAEELDINDAQSIEVVGRIFYADDGHTSIRLSDEAGNPLPYEISVPQEMIEHIRHLWQDTVKITGLTQKNTNLILMQEVKKLG